MVLDWTLCCCPHGRVDGGGDVGVPNGGDLQYAYFPI
jgi:hypothetical protein